VYFYAEKENGAELIAAARALNDGRSLRAIAAELAKQGYVNRNSKPYAANSVQAILGDMPLQSPQAGRKPSHGKRILTGRGMIGGSPPIAWQGTINHLLCCGVTYVCLVTNFGPVVLRRPFFALLAIERPRFSGTK
jgi:hypothetical protein